MCLHSIPAFSVSQTLGIKIPDSHAFPSGDLRFHILSGKRNTAVDEELEKMVMKLLFFTNLLNYVKLPLLSKSSEILWLSYCTHMCLFK